MVRLAEGDAVARRQAGLNERRAFAFADFARSQSSAADGRGTLTSGLRWRAMQVNLIAKRESILGEGPVWDETTGRLYWADIRAGAVEWIEPDSGRHGRLACGAHVSALALRRNGEGALAAADRSVGVLDLVGGRYEARLNFEEDRPRNRTNDGAMGADGRFWFGTMDDDAAPGRGALYCLDPDWTLTRVLDGITIPNGIVSALDAGSLFLADSALQTITRFALNKGAPSLSSGRVFATFAGESTPDGAALDEQGGLWTALWGGSRVVRLTPEGELDISVALPVTQPTSCAFGGADMRTLFVTSARDGLSSQTLEREPLAGSVFAVATNVRGASYPRFGG